MNARSQVTGLVLAVMAAGGGFEQAQAQRVAADIHIGSGPVVGTIRIGDRPYYRSRGYYGRPRYHDAYRAFPNRIVVERRHGWNPRRYRNARFAVVYYDRQCGLYFDRYRRGLEEIRVLYDNDRYYWYDDYRERDDDRFLYDRRGRHERDWDDRNRRDDHDRRDRDDADYGEWEHDH